jgi:hypothetical protein
MAATASAIAASTVSIGNSPPRMPIDATTPK